MYLSIVVAICSMNKLLEFIFGGCSSLILEDIVHEVPELISIKAAIAVNVVLPIDFSNSPAGVFVSELVVLLLFVGRLIIFPSLSRGSTATHFNH